MKRWAGSAAAAVGRAVASLPGIAAMGCAFAGVYLLAGLGWALLSVVPFLLALDRRAAR